MENGCYLRLGLPRQPRKERKASNGSEGKRDEKKVPGGGAAACRICPAAVSNNKDNYYSEADTEASTGCNAEETNLPPQNR
jgi:hypothetical protein